MRMKSILCVLTMLFTSLAALAHGGGLDSYGCHHNRKEGGYHCHRGELKGQSFDSKADMLKKLGVRGNE